MKSSSTPLPSDVDSLQRMLVSMQSENQSLHSEIRVLRDEVEIFRRPRRSEAVARHDELFGRASERTLRRG